MSIRPRSTSATSRSKRRWPSLVRMKPSGTIAQGTTHHAATERRRVRHSTRPLSTHRRRSHANPRHRPISSASVGRRMRNRPKPLALSEAFHVVVNALAGKQNQRRKGALGAYAQDEQPAHRTPSTRSRLWKRSGKPRPCSMPGGTTRLWSSIEDLQTTGTRRPSNFSAGCTHVGWVPQLTVLKLSVGLKRRQARVR